MTNFEKIKAMNVEQLTEVLYDANDRVCFENCAKETGNKYSCLHGEEVPTDACVKCMKNWLESEAVQDE